MSLLTFGIWLEISCRRSITLEPEHLRKKGSLSSDQKHGRNPCTSSFVEQEHSGTPWEGHFFEFGDTPLTVGHRD